ncbi:hypothetical protein [Photorhabdus tasmaniensis]|uniref:Uncharacterized protein n=1 Tax=Photorhabdus tasmaniensis TaxID=1004159 RepID=A0ABX0GGA0_9GAMM|nr:hypothetical protein [Photorhabdus tasmaniensis]NHB87336.1 hypothetical protein [Photorhabdus tasmaniensis]
MGSLFGSEGAKHFEGAGSLAQKMAQSGATSEEINAALTHYLKGQVPDGQDPAKGLIIAWGNFFGVPLDVVLSNEQMTPQKAAEIVAGGIPTSEAKLIQFAAAKAFLSLSKYQSTEVVEGKGSSLAGNNTTISSMNKGKGTSERLPESHIKEVTAAEVNNWWKNQGYGQPPYTPGTTVKEFELAANTKFVRVYDGTNSQMRGGWMMKAEDIKGLSSKQIQEKFALPYEPKYIADVEIKAGTKMRTGSANSLFGYKGGGTQFDLMGQRTGIFTNERAIQKK